MLPILGWEGELGSRTFLHDRGETEGGVLTARLTNPGSYPSILHNLRLAPGFISRDRGFLLFFKNPTWAKKFCLADFNQDFLNSIIRSGFLSVL